MSEIGELESRITAALDRIRQGLDAQMSGAPEQADDAALEAERATSAQLTEDLQAMQTAYDSVTAQFEAQKAQMALLDAELQSLRASNVQLRDMNTALREAVTEGLAPELLDKAIAAEVEALHAQRSADAAEIDAILTELTPLIEEPANAAG
ncbi:hypothetical protein ACJ5NV_10200 [Loktanella agnita]|uniref:hypothetical protein n=1 Tax=Loktanella agnita TaxID=287097 RepID=UPI003988A119